ncbi:type IA DNA topoisomerase [Campylobacter jejuni]|nr:type IA DNA topoisomerase [Campylobacter jejuni]
MKDTIIIIESPNKIEKIEKITGAKVFATKGHFKQLTNNIVENFENYKPIFEIKSEKKQFMNNIFKDCENKNIIIATDPDREGYGIAYLFYETIKNKAKSIKRALFHEITESGIQKGLKEAIPFNQTNEKEYYSFLGRAVSDKMIGFILSPKYIRIFNDKNISLGRVQSPALFLIVKKEREIKEYYEKGLDKILNYKIKVKANKNNVDFFFTSQKIYENKEEALENIEKLKTLKGMISKKESKEVKINPKMPFRTSQLQENANKILGFSPETTMKNAQSLFEKGLITYHRTDSNSLSKEFLDEVEKIFKNEEWYQKREYKAGKQSQAEAHEAIRITHAHKYEEIQKIAEEEKLSDDEINLYKLIYSNSIQSQAKSAINENTNYELMIGFNTFELSISKPIYKGFKSIFLYEEDEEEKNQDQIEINLDFEKGEEISIINYELSEVKKQAPKRYKEASFVNLLEKTGIGRPSTYATYLPKLNERDYIKLEKAGKNNEIIPTQKGMELIEKAEELKEDFWIFDTEYTKIMEEMLDSISKGEETYLNYIKTIHQKLNFKEINQKKEIIPPSENQLMFLNKLAKECEELGLKINIDENCKKDYRLTTKIINDLIALKEKNKPKYKPTEKMINYAVDIATKLNIDLPENLKEDSVICKNFIEKNQKKLKNKG